MIGHKDRNRLRYLQQDSDMFSCSNSSMEITRYMVRVPLARTCGSQILWFLLPVLDLQIITRGDAQGPSSAVAPLAWFSVRIFNHLLIMLF